MPGGDVIIVNMSEPANVSDLELLARYNRQHAEDAFATDARRKNQEAIIRSAGEKRPARAGD
jgi:hypothetical protein